MDEEKKAPPAGAQEGHNEVKGFQSFITDPPLTVNPNAGSIPEDLKRIPQWVNWKYKKTGESYRVLAIVPTTGRPAAPGNPGDWDTFEATLNCHRASPDTIAGVGFMLTDRDPFCAILLENCRYPENGQINQKAAEIIEHFNSYTEISASGMDISIILKGKPQSGRNRKLPTAEVLFKIHCIPMTGAVLDGRGTIQERQVELERFIEKETIGVGNIVGARTVSPESHGSFSGRGSPRKGAKCLVSCIQDRDEPHNGKSQTAGLRVIQYAMELTKVQEWVSCKISEPIRDDPSPAMPELGAEALYGIAGRFVRLATADSEADPAAVLATFLVRFGVEAGSRVHMMIGDAKHYARIFAIIVGDSSKSRKGTSAKPVESLFAFSAVRTSHGPLSSGEGLIHAVRNESDRSWENYDFGVQDKRLFVIDEEFSGALACSKRQGNILSTVIRSAWDSGDLDPLTKHLKESTTGAHIGVISHITLYELNSRMDNVEVFNGLANRFLWVHARRRKLVPLPAPTEFSALQGELKRVLDAVSKHNEIRLSPDAKVKWEAVYPELSADHPGLLGCIVNRAEAQVLRLAMIYCLTDGADTIEVDHLKAALAFWEYCRRSSVLIFRGRERDSVLQRVVDFLATGPKSKTEIHNRFSNHLKREELELALKELLETGRVWVEKIGTGGAPKWVYRLKGK